MIYTLEVADNYYTKSDQEMLDELVLKVGEQLYVEIAEALHSGNKDLLDFATRTYVQLCLLPKE